MKNQNQEGKMDVVVGSIDVRELLSSSDLDSASPLSAPDLRLLIDRLNLRSLEIKSRVRSYVLAHRHHFAGVFSLSADLADSSDSLSRSLHHLLQLLSDSQADREILDLLREFAGGRRELKEKREALGFVRLLSDLADGIRVSREELGEGKVKAAAERMRVLKKKLRIGSPEEKEEDDKVEVFRLLRSEWTDCFDQLQGVLARRIENSVHFEVENGRVAVRCQPRIGRVEDCELYTTLEAMETVEVLDYGLGRVADSMIKHVMNPAISDGTVKIFIEPDEDSVEPQEAILRLLPSSEYQEHLDGPTIYARLIVVIKFIHKFMFFENEAWMRCFGRLTWPRMSDLIITYSLSKAVPDDASKLADFQNIIKDTAEFEIFLKEIKFISAADSAEERLSHFTQNVEVHFAAKKRHEILAKARDIILQFDFSENTLEHSLQSSCQREGFSECVADLLFCTEKCLVSKAVSQLMELVHAALKDACLSSTRVAKEFYHAARDALLLYKAIVPIKLEKQLDGISRLAIIVHNDCYYLSQEILGLAYEYRADFPSGLKKLAVFVDIAPNLYQMADLILEKQTKVVDNSLMEAIDGADGFQNTHQPQQYSLAKFSIEQVGFILEKIRIIWEPLMSASTFKKTICIFLDSVFSRITKDMLLLDDMAAEETFQLQGLIHMTLENLSSIFGSLVDFVNEKDNSLQLILDMLDEKIPSLSKFRKLADLLDMPLKSITTVWESGELHNCGFTASEVENFVKAIFTDSPLRKECLWRIESTRLKNL